MTVETPSRRGVPQLNEQVNLLLAPGVLEIIRAETVRYAGEDMETGGIMVGKWLDEQTVIVVAATNAGPNADHQRLTYAVDVEYANAELERLAALYPGVDYIGEWHKHPPTLDYPSSGDLYSARRLLNDPSYPPRLINPISVFRAPKALVNFFHLAHGQSNFERLKPRLLSASEVQQILPTASEASYVLNPAPKVQVVAREPSWWLSAHGAERLRLERENLRLKDNEVINDYALEESTWVFEIAPKRFHRNLIIKVECSGRYDQGDPPFIQQTKYKGMEFLPQSPIIAHWGSQNSLWELAEDIKRQQATRNRRPMLMVGVAVLMLLLVGALITLLVLNGAQSERDLASANQKATALANDLQKSNQGNLDANQKIAASQSEQTALAVTANIQNGDLNYRNTELAGQRATISALQTVLGPNYVPPTSTATPKSGTSDAKPQFYDVKFGDRLSDIANRNGMDVNSLKEINKDYKALGLANSTLMPNDNISAGGKLVIKSGLKNFQGRAVVIKAGENVSSIAKANSLTVEQVRQVTGLAASDEGKPGDILLLPGK